MKRADLYIRVSTDEQADKGYSQRDQEERLKRFCTTNKITVGQIIYEDHSAKTFNRPEWIKLLNSLKKLDDLGIAENTIVVWTTDNGAEVFSWPDGGTTPFKGEKNTNWEGGYRVPLVMRWPGVIKPGTEINEITSHEDLVPTLVAAAGEASVKEKLLAGYAASGKTFKVHLDGYDQRELLAGTGPSKRHEYFYWTDDGNLAGLRYNKWKLSFLEQRSEGLDVWQDPLVVLRFPKLFDIKADPFERAQSDAGDYARWRVEHAFALVPAQAFVARHLATYRDFPPRQKPGSFSLDQVLSKLQEQPTKQ